MDFNELTQVTAGESFNPYAGKTRDGKWIEGTMSIYFLNLHFGMYSTAKEMINATESEGLKLYFVWLRNQGILN